MGGFFDLIRLPGSELRLYKDVRADRQSNHKQGPLSPALVAKSSLVDCYTASLHFFMHEPI
jgi:hypothetical protein